MNKILESAYKAWSAAADLRERRERYKNYTYGDQWCDTVRDARGRAMREDRYLQKNGSRPLTNNLIRQLVKTIVGRYRTQASEGEVYKGGDIARLSERNCLPELDSRLLEEFLISGCAIQRIVDERRWGGCGVWIDNVDPRHFFVNAFRDPRGWDIDMIGMLHDMTMAELINRFAGDSHERAADLRRLYADTENGASFGAPDLGASAGPVNFFSTSDSDRCRVIEVWSLDCRGKDGGQSVAMDFVWHCRHFSPDGTVLAEYDSPYGHRSHPFAVKFYPLTDGEVHSFVEDVIDQQRHINRLIVMIDKMMSTAAKGVLLFPANQKIDGMPWSDITSVWAHSDGVIPITGNGDHLPQQVVTNTSGSGAYQLLEMQMKLLEDISGVGDALMGRTPGSVRGVEMFDTQVRNATIALADIFETFAAFTQVRNNKALTTR